MDLNSESGASSWLTALPLAEQGFQLSKQEFCDALHSGGSRMGHLGQMPPPPPFTKLHTRSRYSNRAVNYSNKVVTMFMRQCSLPMKL